MKRHLRRLGLGSLVLAALALLTALVIHLFGIVALVVPALVTVAYCTGGLVGALLEEWRSTRRRP